MFSSVKRENIYIFFTDNRFKDLFLSVVFSVFLHKLKFVFLSWSLTYSAYSLSLTLKLLTFNVSLSTNTHLSFMRSWCRAEGMYQQMSLWTGGVWRSLWSRASFLAKRVHVHFGDCQAKLDKWGAYRTAGKPWHWSTHGPLTPTISA